MARMIPDERLLKRLENLEERVRQLESKQRLTKPFQFVEDKKEEERLRLHYMTAARVKSLFLK
jgi:hypothetical protein